MTVAAKKVRGPGKRPNRLSDDATRAKKRAKAIFDEYVQAHNGIAPKTTDICECLAREGLARTWRNFDFIMTYEPPARGLRNFMRFMVARTLGISTCV
jgi:hypothetical protein